MFVFRGPTSTTWPSASPPLVTELYRRFIRLAPCVSLRPAVRAAYLRMVRRRFKLNRFDEVRRELGFPPLPEPELWTRRVATLHFVHNSCCRREQGASRDAMDLQNTELRVLRALAAMEDEMYRNPKADRRLPVDVYDYWMASLGSPGGKVATKKQRARVENAWGHDSLRAYALTVMRLNESAGLCI